MRPTFDEIAADTLDILSEEKLAVSGSFPQILNKFISEGIDFEDFLFECLMT